MGKGSGNSSCRPALALKTNSPAEDPKNPFSPYSNTQEALDALVFRGTKHADSVWTDKASKVAFINRNGSWEWQLMPGIEKNQNQTTPDDLKNLHKLLETLQKGGFKSRTDVINYVEMVVGKNTIWKVDFESLRKGQSGSWKIPETKFVLRNRNAVSGVNLEKPWSIGSPIAQVTNTKFKTRKDAIDYLFSMNLL